MKIYHIVAMSKNSVIGKDGDLPFRIPGDLKRFKELTVNHAVLMGRKTWNSLPEKFRPLSDRLNIVLSRTETIGVHPALEYASNIEKGIKIAKDRCYNELYIIGGGEIYKQTLELVHEIRMTIWKDDVEGDTFYPELNQADWYEVYEKDMGTHIYKDFVRNNDGLRRII